LSKFFIILIYSSLIFFRSLPQQILQQLTDRLNQVMIWAGLHKTVEKLIEYFWRFLIWWRYKETKLTPMTWFLPEFSTVR
jgi:hypothetical protein